MLEPPSEKKLGGHDAQVDMDAAPITFEAVPGKQGVQEDVKPPAEELYDPMGHGVQPTDPEMALLKSPDLQLWQGCPAGIGLKNPLAQGEQLTDPEAVASIPAGHAEHGPTPAAALKFGEQ